MLVVLKAPTQLIKKVFNCCREAANDAFAISYFCGGSSRVLKWILGKVPGAVQHQDEETDNLPLHEACYVSNSNTPRRIRFIYESYPEALTTKNDEVETPFHVACGKNTPDAVRFLRKKMVLSRNNATMMGFCRRWRQLYKFKGERRLRLAAIAHSGLPRLHG